MKYHLTLATFIGLSACVNQNELAYEGSETVSNEGTEIEANEFNLANGGYGTGYNPKLTESVGNYSDSADPASDGL